MAQKSTYRVKMEVRDKVEVMVDVDTGLPITGRVTLAGMVFQGAGRDRDGKLVMTFSESDDLDMGATLRSVAFGDRTSTGRR